jgi:hypothetical protein
MLTAPKDEKKAPAVTAAANAPALAGLSEVLNSVQGLQQRLGDFSFDEVSKADEKAKTLILRLAELQRKLGSLANIHRFVIAARTEASQASTESADLSKLKAIIHASEPTRFPGANNGANENGDHQSLAAVSPASQSDTSKTDISTGSPLTATAIDGDETREPAIATSTQPLSSSSSKEDFPGITAAESSARSEIPLQNAATDSRGSQAKALVLTSSDFDQQLLDDLIKNYGEFATSPNLPATCEPPSATPHKSTDRSTIRGFQPEEAESVKRNVPGLKKEGELDQKLKKLIKDYGEYDLYSRKSPIALKTGVIIAFLLLGVIFTGYYFFSAPKSAGSPDVASDGKSTSSSSTGAIETSKEAERNGRKTVSNRNAASTDSHATLETADKQEIPNKNFAKEKK